VTDALEVLSARSFSALPEPDRSGQLLGPLVVRGFRTIVVAETGHGKTTLTLQMLAGIVTGAHVLGHAGAGVGPVLVVDLEQGRRSIKRGLREAALEDREDVLVASAPDGLALDADLGHRQALEQLVEERRPAAVALDPYYKAHRADDPNAERPVVELMRYLDGLRARYGFALLLPAHPRKDAPGRNAPRKLRLDDVAGSGAVVRGAEVILGLERLGHGAARLRILKDREGDLPVGEAWSLLFERGSGFRLDPREAVAEDAIEEQIVSDVARGALRTVPEWATELHLRESRTRKILDRLAEAGHVKVVVGPPGRSSRARCYGSPPAGWADLGGVGELPAAGELLPLLPTPLEGGVGSGSSDPPPSSPGGVAEEK
jgi:hypothetical protein